MAGVFGRISSMLGIRMRKPKRPPISIPETGGHRGIALGLGNKPTTKPGNRNLIPRNEVDEFVNGGYPLLVHSSNVRMAQYFPEDQKMMVEYGLGAAYLYSDVTQHEALSFAQAQSKGTWVWDHLRVRGSKTAHKKPYVKISSGYRPPKKQDEIDLTDMVPLPEEYEIDVSQLTPLQDEVENMLGLEAAPDATKNTGKNAPTWTYRGEKVRANTKGEARAWFTAKFGKLPPGADVQKVP